MYTGTLEQCPLGPPHRALCCGQGQAVGRGTPGLKTKRLKVDGLLLTGAKLSPSGEDWTSYVHRHLGKVSQGRDGIQAGWPSRASNPPCLGALPAVPAGHTGCRDGAGAQSQPENMPRAPPPRIRQGVMLWPLGGDHRGWDTDRDGVATLLTHLEPTCSSDQTKRSCPRVRGRARSRVTCAEGGTRDWGGGGGGSGGGDTHLPGLAASPGARTHEPAGAKAAGAQGGASGGHPQGKGAALWPLGPGDRGGFSGSSDLRSCAAPHPTLPADLGRAHAPELLRRGEDWPAEALPFTIGAAEPVVQVERDIDEHCGAKKDAGATLPGPPRQKPQAALPGAPAYWGLVAPHAGAGSR